MINWWNEIDFPITVCDTGGIILEMNRASILNFAKDGGETLIGKSLLDCHPEPARTKLVEMLKSRTSHTYKSRKSNRLVRQFPWYQDGFYMGFVEMLIPLPDGFCTIEKDNSIYHISRKVEWNIGLEKGSYSPSGYPVDHFIHCSTLAQVLPVAERYYQEVDDLVLLKIDPGRLACNLVFENLEGGKELFPHIYGELNLEAVVGVKQFLKNDQGKFTFPF